jgi:putative FmdB family regulatory protein
LPLYAYRCTQCGHRFEKIQHFNSKPEMECPKCHGVLERPLTAPAFKFKGSGWYVNDYAGKNSAVTADSTPTESKPAETKKPACAGKCAAASACPAAAAAHS